MNCKRKQDYFWTSVLSKGIFYRFAGLRWRRRCADEWRVSDLADESWLRTIPEQWTTAVLHV